MAVQALVHLGDAPPWELALREEAWRGPAAALASQHETVATPLDVAAETQAALESPLGFPPISQAMVPGDQIAIAIGGDVRKPDLVARGVVAALLAAGAELPQIVIVAGDIADANRLRPTLQDLTDRGLVVVGHEANDDQALCYVAAVDDTPLLMNRQLFEADVVIPVGCVRSAAARDSRGPYDSLYPRFADKITQNSYAQANALDSPTAVATRRRETDQAGWLLGASLAVQVVPGPGGEVARVLAGTPEELAKESAAAHAQQWARPVEQRANLVVATLAGDETEQTWDNVARALHAAASVVEYEESAVAICTELDTRPGTALRELAAADGDLERAAQIGEIQSPDAAAAWEIYKALCRGPVFFMSRLAADVVEDLGMSPIANRDELARLAMQAKSCVVLDESQHAMPHLQE